MPLYSATCPLPKNQMLRRHQTAPFSPADITGLSLWLKADAGVTVSGASVTEWADQSGNGLDVVPDFTNADITLASSVAKFNNKPAILFGVTNENGDVGLYNNNPFIGKSVFLVYSLESVSGFQYSVAYENNGINAYTSYEEDEEPNRKFGGYFNGFFDSDTTSALGTAYIRTVIADGDEEENDPLDFYINGESDGSLVGSGFYNLRSEIVIGNGGAREAGPSPSINQPFQGYIAEVVVYTTVLTTPEREQVETYLNDKYAIY